MRHFNLQTLFLPFIRYLLLIFIFMFTFNVDSFAKKENKKKKLGWEVKLKLATIYDDNILKYSDKYLDRFMNGIDQYRFHIETYDDVIFFTSVGVTKTFKFFGKNKNTKINGELSRRTYAVNSIKDWNYFTIGIRQYLTKSLSFKLLYSYIPDFYVRHFRDEQWVDVYGFNNPDSFQPYSFAKDNFGFWIQNTFFKNTRIKLSLFYSPYYHNEHYTEYDSDNWTYGIHLYQKLHKKFRIELGYQFVTSDAKGYDSSVETPENTNGPDATYIEDKFIIGFDYKLPNIKKIRHSFDAKCLIFNRYYSSEHPWQTDPLHAGRYDYNLRFYFNYKVRINKSWLITAYYNWLGRNTSTTAEANAWYVSNEKDYRQNIFGLMATYTLKF